MKIGEAAPLYAVPDYDAITQVLRSMAGKLFGVSVKTTDARAVLPPLVIGGSAPVIESGTVTEAVADVAILAEPRGQMRLEITDPNGKKVASGSPYKNRTAAPGIWNVRAEAPGCEIYEGSFVAIPDDVTVHRIEVKKLGGLDITGEPVGAAVTVTGPGGF